MLRQSKHITGRLKPNSELNKSSGGLDATVASVVSPLSTSGVDYSNLGFLPELGQGTSPKEWLPVKYARWKDISG